MTYEDAADWFEDAWDLDWWLMSDDEIRAFFQASFRDKSDASLEDAVISILRERHGEYEAPAPVTIDLPSFTAPPAPVVSAPAVPRTVPGLERAPAPPPAPSAPAMRGVERAFASVGRSIDRAVSAVGRAFGRLFRR